MARKLLTVTGVFQVEGRGVCVMPVLVPVGNEVIHQGDAIDIKCPDGQVMRTRMANLCLPTPNPDHGWIIMFPSSVQKSDVPIGAEIWSVDS